MRRRGASGAPAATLTAALLATALLAAAPAVSATAGSGAEDDLLTLSLEELMDVEVFTAAKKDQRLFDTAAAVTVITGQDLRRSGATTLPEVLRQVPGLQVARVDANKWGISARGFNGRFANKLQVLVDGRTLYTPVFAGVFWREQDLVLEDVERIEVIRGPGATLWGANAVNGIINIITKRAADTQGLLVSAGTGTEERGFVSVRAGAALGPRRHVRVYAKAFDRDDFVDAGGRRAADGWRGAQLGFRLDSDDGDGGGLTLQGQVYDGDAGQTYELIRQMTPPYYEVFDEDSGFAGSHLLGRWERDLRRRGDLALQAYVDRHDLDDSALSETRHTVDVDAQHRWPLGDTHEVVYGLGYRWSRDAIDVSFPFEVAPRQRTLHLLSAFAQDEIGLAADRLRITAGIKLEHNSFTGLEAQPNLRALWQPSQAQSLWAAVARATRTPARAETDGLFPSEILPGATPEDRPLFFALVGNPEMASEVLWALEAGYRVRPNALITADVAAFYNIYDRLLSYELRLDRIQLRDEPAPHALVPIYGDNLRNARTHGLEIQVEGQPRPDWRVHAAYTYLGMDVDLDAGSRDPLADAAEGESPQHQVVLRSALDLPGRVGLDAGLRYVAALPALGVGRYTSLDLRLSWRPTPELELALVGQDLLDARHPEFRPEYLGTRPTQTQRGIYGQVVWQR